MEPFEEQLGRSMHSESVGLLHRQCSNPADHGTIRTLWFLPSAIEDVPDSTKVLLKLRNPSDSRESPTLGPASGGGFNCDLMKSRYFGRRGRRASCLPTGRRRPASLRPLSSHPTRTCTVLGAAAGTGCPPLAVGTPHGGHEGVSTFGEEFLAAHEVVLKLERLLAAARGEEHAVPLDFPVRWDIGAPLPHVIQNDYKTFLTFYIREPDPDWDGSYVTVKNPGDGSVESLALVEFIGCTQQSLALRTTRYSRATR